MNVDEIKKTRDEAASRILEILRELESVTGMVVASVDVDNDFDDDMKNLGVTRSTIKLELE